MRVAVQISSGTDEHDTIVRKSGDGAGISIIRGVLKESILAQEWGWEWTGHGGRDQWGSAVWVGQVAEVSEEIFFAWADKNLPKFLQEEIRGLP